MGLGSFNLKKFIPNATDAFVNVGGQKIYQRENPQGYTSVMTQGSPVATDKFAQGSAGKIYEKLEPAKYASAMRAQSTPSASPFDPDYSDMYGTADNEATGPINAVAAAPVAPTVADLALQSAGRKTAAVVRNKDGSINSEIFTKHTPIDHGEYVDPTIKTVKIDKSPNRPGGPGARPAKKAGTVKRTPGPKKKGPVKGSRNAPKMFQNVRTTSGNPFAKNFGGWGQLFQGDKTTKVGKPYSKPSSSARKKALRAQALKAIDMF